MSIPHYPFYFLRHGETDWNRMNLIMGQTDIPLNENGNKQVQEVRNDLKEINLSRIWSSPLRRAQQTADILNKPYNYFLEYHDSLKERCWGKGEGESHDQFLPDQTPILNAKNIDNGEIPEGAEAYDTFEARIILAFQEILNPSPNPPLVVSHGGVLQVLSIILRTSLTPAKNCSLYYFYPPELEIHPWQITNLSE